MARVWWPKTPSPRFNRKDAESGLDASSWLGVGDIAEGFAVFAVIAAVVTVVLLMFTVVFPLVIFGIELLIVLVLFLAGVLGRLLLGHPWTVRAKGSNGREMTWQVKGLGASGRACDEVAQALANGDRSPRPADALT